MNMIGNSRTLGADHGQTPVKHDTRMSLDEVYAEVEARDANAWRGPQSQCRASSRARPMTRDEAQALKDAAYAAYDEEEMENAWRPHM